MAKFPKDSDLAFTDLYCISASVPKMCNNRFLCKASIGAVKRFIIFSIIFIYVSVQALKWHSLIVMLEKKILVA